jgi:hypothetical protein
MSLHNPVIFFFRILHGAKLLVSHVNNYCKTPEAESGISLFIFPTSLLTAVHAGWPITKWNPNQVTTF